MTAQNSARWPRALLVTGMVVALSACAGSKVRDLWPFGKKPLPPPPAVQVVQLAAVDGQPLPAVLQYWQRNTLLIDLQQAGANGAVQLTPPADGRWPARIGFRVAPAQFPALEVRAAQRAILPVRNEGPGPLIIPLAPSVYTQQSTQIDLRWGAPPPPPPPPPEPPPAESQPAEPSPPAADVAAPPAG